MNRLQQLADIRNKIYQVTEKLAIEMDLHLEATKIDNQAIYALSKISDTYAKLVMTEEKLEQEIAKREAIEVEKLAEEATPPDEEISAADKVILGMIAEKLYGPDNIKPSEANYNYDYYKEKGFIKEPRKDTPLSTHFKVPSFSHSEQSEESTA